jgi:hypothetical protein
LKGVQIPFFHHVGPMAHDHTFALAA